MRDDRTKTIINEIKYWRDNRLLPSQYCDFLLALYTQGGDGIADQEKTRPLAQDYNLFFYLSITIVLFLLPLSFLVIYFTEMDIIMQTGLLSTFVILAWIHYWWLTYKKFEWLFIPLFVALLTMFLESVMIIQHVFQSETSLYILVAFHCSLWMWIGRKLGMKTLVISGVSGFLLLIIYIVL